MVAYRAETAMVNILRENMGILHFPVDTLLAIFVGCRRAHLFRVQLVRTAHPTIN